MYILLASFAVVVGLVFYILLDQSNRVGNVNRNLTSEHGHAHFSAIDSGNYALTPSLLWTSPRRFHLAAGESVFIPRGWWHWIRTHGPSTAVNFWMKSDKTRSDVPHLILDSAQPPSLLTEIEKAGTTADVWKSDVDVISSTAEINADDEYVITLEGYRPVHTPFDKLNEDMLNIAKKHAIIPSGADMNIWISKGYHDTGLHYDDNDGILTVLRGTKDITMYPPSDTPYLRPLTLIPAWARQKAAKVYYNLYHFDRYLPETSLPSSRILYESIKNRAVLREITKMKRETNIQLVWGCKWQDGVMRWEIYAYHYNIYNNSIDNTKLEGFRVKKKTKCLIHSIDLFDTENPVGSDIHYYYKTSPGSQFPIKGVGFTGHTTPESIFYIDIRERMIAGFEHYAIAAGFTMKHISRCKKLLYRYPCKQIAIWNKYKNQIYIQYYGISASDFVSFLKEHKYPESLVTHVATNNYEDIEHEITIVYDLDTLQSVRTGFYGIV